jgi:hypothetical protein
MPQVRTSAAVQIFAIIMTVSAILTGTMYILTHMELAKVVVTALEHSAENKTLKQMVRDYEDREQQLKNALAYQQSELGDFNSPDPLTVLGSMRADLDELNLSPSPLNIRDALAQWKHEKEKYSKSDKAMQEQVTDLRTLLNSLESRWMALLNVEKNNHKESKKELADTLATRSELIEGKNRQLQEYRENMNQVQQRLTILENEYQAKAKDWTERERMLHNTISRMRNQLATIKGEINQVEEPDAEIIKYEGFTNTIWLNRGSLDLLQPGVVFVITSSREIDKGKQKGRAQVTKIIGEHLAEAKFIDGKGTVLNGDHLSSSLWSPGQVQKFVLAGLFDLDDDGKSDMDIIKTYLEKSGAKLVGYGDEQGNHVGEKIDADVTGLVIGNIPDPTLAKTEKSRSQAEAIMNHATMLRHAADDYGIDIITRQKFLLDLGLPRLK